MRAFCGEHGIIYQGFSLLTANRRCSGSTAGEHRAAAPDHARAGRVRFRRNLGMLPLTGTDDPEHMQQDLASLGLTLQPVESAALERLGR